MFYRDAACEAARHGDPYADNYIGDRHIGLQRIGVISLSGSDNMRDVFEEIFALESLEPVDPTEAARRHMRALKRRFYDEVTVRDDPAGFAVALDGRPIKTPPPRAPPAPCRPLGEAIAAEWRAPAQCLGPAAKSVGRAAHNVIGRARP